MQNRSRAMSAHISGAITALLLCALLSGCALGGTTESSTASPVQSTPHTASPQPSPAPPPDPIAISRGYHAALNAKKVDEALAYFSDDGVLTDPFGSFTGKQQIRNRLLVVTDREITFAQPQAKSLQQLPK